MNYKELFQEAEKFIKENNLTLYCITIHPGGDVFGTTTILQGVRTENEEFCTKSPMLLRVNKEGNYYEARINNIEIILSKF